MEKLYKRLAVTFTVSAILSLMIFAVSLYFRGKSENGRYLDQLLVNVEMNLEHASEKYRENFEYQEQECLRRARSAEYIASNDTRVLEREGLEILKTLMKVKDISLIDRSGTIFLSTNDSLEGSSEDRENMAELRGNEESGDDHPGVIHVDIPGFEEAPEYMYALAGADSDGLAAVRVDADLSRTEFVSGKDLTNTILKQSTTDYGTSVFAISRRTGEVFGKTENNSPSIRIDELEEGPELLKYITELPKDRPMTLRINGEYQSTVIRELDSMYLMAFSGLDRVTGDIFLTFLLDLVVLSVLSGLTLLLLRRHLQNYEKQLSKARTEAEHDRLTGLYNRNGFERRAEQFLEKESPGGAFILFDLDNFKQVNDSAGHPEGDHVLQIFAKCLTEFFRKEDIIGRLGGDEFAVLLGNTIRDDILEDKIAGFHAEVRRRLGKYYDTFSVSASIGAVPVDGTVRDYRKLYRCADVALYMSKHRGKDRFYINNEMIDCL